MKKLLIIKTGGSFEEFTREHDDFEHWTANGMGLSFEDCLCVDVRTGSSLPDPADIAGCVITGSHDMVTDDLPWIHTTARWLREALHADLPLLGICFGHQLMAHALGGKAGYHPDGLEIGTVDITLTEDGMADPLMGSLPSFFKAHVTHSQTALELPPNTTLLAASDHDPHQSFRIGLHAWGVQFHPEFDTSAIHFYVQQLQEKITDQGGDVANIRETVVETPESTSLLKRFAAYCLNS
ncbi:glutamine amidotransferase [uncultured Pseudodesulfovibrio sp.]|uniref:glutamine amidotransferase n=1 Tax=uncultured Pseudodesulfovibrio sp. TaxID=2035858 RepID=UPI0029C8A9F2|nr:glutamine amidotransferase [uncultured Pseudodesulfovibrio sp.]